MVMTTWWVLTFAWWPVYVDAYDMSEYRNHQSRYLVWMRHVECSHEIWIDDDDSRTPIYRHRCRLPRKP